MKLQRLQIQLMGPPLKKGSPIRFMNRRGFVERVGKWYLVIGWRQEYIFNPLKDIEDRWHDSPFLGRSLVRYKVTQRNF